MYIFSYFFQYFHIFSYMFVDLLVRFVVSCSIWARREAGSSLKMTSRGVETFSTIEHAILRTSSIFSYMFLYIFIYVPIFSNIFLDFPIFSIYLPIFFLISSYIILYMFLYYPIYFIIFCTSPRINSSYVW